MNKFDTLQLDALEIYLRSRLSTTLPGKSAQYKMAGLRRIEQLFDSYDITKARPSGVLILLYSDNNQIKFVMIRRPEYDGVHSGQIAFPGGRKEETDADIVETALRESFEEAGIEPKHVTVIGKLSDLFIPPSNFVVSPVIGVMSYKPDFIADPVEVAEIIEVALSELLNPEALTQKTVTVGSWTAEVPCYFLQNQVVWGATAMILSEFIEILAEFSPSIQ